MVGGEAGGFSFPPGWSPMPFSIFYIVLFCFVCSAVAWYVDEVALKGVAIDDPIGPHKDVPHHKAILPMVEPGIPLILIVDLIAF